MFPRGLAVNVLTAVLSDSSPLDQALDRISQQAKLEPQARAWLLDVCAGTLRWKGRLDLAIDATAIKKKPSGWLRKMMLVGAYQLIVSERVAAALVVSETVTEVKKKEGEHPSKFVNASLRKVADYAKEWRNLPFPEKGTLSEQATWACLPDWFWRRISEQHGVAWAREYALASFERPKLWLRMAPGAQIPDEGVKGAVANSYAPNDGGAISERAGFSEGNFFVQDISSQLLVSEISSEAKSILKKEHPSGLDLCAAPGGKALGLAWNGFTIHATDIDESRLKLIRENIQRLKSDIQVVTRSEVAKLEPQDLVWVDAPCTGSGIIRRHPDVRWLRREKDIDSLVVQQLKLVREAWELVRPGGVMAYSVCSVFNEEGPQVIEKAGLKDRIRKTWNLAPQQAPGGDGFWACVLAK